MGPELTRLLPWTLHSPGLRERALEAQRPPARCRSWTEPLAMAEKRVPAMTTCYYLSPNIKALTNRHEKEPPCGVVCKQLARLSSPGGATHKKLTSFAM